MKKKRNIFCLVILCIIILAGVGIVCHFLDGNNTEMQGKQKSSVTTADYTKNSYTDLGLFSITNDSMLMFQDASSGEKAYVCDKANCEHIPYDEVTNPEPECTADAHRDTFVLSYDDKIYLLGRDKDQTGTDNQSLYQEDIDGANRKKLLTLDDTAMNLWLYGVCNGKYLAVSYSSNYEVNQDNNIVESDNVKTGIIIVDLSSKKIINKVLARATQAACYDISLHESKLYYVFNYTDDRYDKEKAATLSDQEYVPYVAEHMQYEYHCCNLGLGEEDEILDVTVMPMGDMAAMGCELFYENMDGDLCLYNDKTKESSKIYSIGEGDKEVDYRPIGLLNQGLLYCNYKEEGTEWYLYDRKMKESKLLCTNTYMVLGTTEQYIYAQDITEEVVIECFTLEQFQKLESSGKEIKRESSTNSGDAVSDDKTVVWGISEITQMDTAIESRINQYLTEKGYDYKVKFQVVDHLASAKKMEEKYPALDIVQTANAMYYTDSACQLIREKYFSNLGNYLLSDGKSLYQSMPSEKWKQVMVDGEIYTVPNTFFNDRGMYFAFNPQYVSKEVFQKFDGTIQGMEKIVLNAAIEEKEKSIVLENLSGFLLDGLVGGSFDEGLYLSNEEKRAGLWFEQKDVKEVYETLHRLYSKGYIDGINTMTDNADGYHELIAEVAENNYVVCVGNGNYANSEFYRKDALVYQCKKPIVSKVAGSIGVVNSSEQKEYALELLKLAFTDQKLANLMVYGLPEDSYTVKDGVLTDCSDSAEYRAFDNGIEFGNYLVASPLSKENIKSRMMSLENYYEKYGVESSLLGYNISTGDYADKVKTLTELEMDNQDIWKSNDFEKDYQEILAQINTEDNKKFVEYINAQIQDWEDKVTK